MPRRLLAAVAAVLLAAAGAWVLLSYVRGADARAQAGEQLVPVLVVDAPVADGTPADQLTDSVSLAQVPSRLVGADALADLTTVSGLVTTVNLLPGEMLQSGRFGDPTAIRADGSLPTPDGLVEVSATLDRQRAGGGTLTPGDRVGVTLTSTDTSSSGLTALSTFRVLHDVLVTRVTPPAEGDLTAGWTITVAVSPTDAETVVLGLEGQAVWLSLESDGDDGSSTSAPSSATTVSTATTGADQ